MEPSNNNLVNFFRNAGSLFREIATQDLSTAKTTIGKGYVLINALVENLRDRKVDDITSNVKDPHYAPLINKVQKLQGQPVFPEQRKALEKELSKLGVKKNPFIHHSLKKEIENLPPYPTELTTDEKIDALHRLFLEDPRNREWIQTALGSLDSKSEKLAVLRTIIKEYPRDPLALRKQMEKTYDEISSQDQVDPEKQEYYRLLGQAYFAVARDRGTETVPGFVRLQSKIITQQSLLARISDLESSVKNADLNNPKIKKALTQELAQCTMFAVKSNTNYRQEMDTKLKFVRDTLSPTLEMRVDQLQKKVEKANLGDYKQIADLQSEFEQCVSLFRKEQNPEIEAKLLAIRSLLFPTDEQKQAAYQAFEVRIEELKSKPKVFPFEIAEIKKELRTLDPNFDSEKYQLWIMQLGLLKTFNSGDSIEERATALAKLPQDAPQLRIEKQNLQKERELQQEIGRILDELTTNKNLTSEKYDELYEAYSSLKDRYSDLKQSQKIDVLRMLTLLQGMPVSVEQKLTNLQEELKNTASPTPAMKREYFARFERYSALWDKFEEPYRTELSGLVGEVRSLLPKDANKHIHVPGDILTPAVDKTILPDQMMLVVKIQTPQNGPERLAYAIPIELPIDGNIRVRTVDSFGEEQELTLPLTDVQILGNESLNKAYDNFKGEVYFSKTVESDPQKTSMLLELERMVQEASKMGLALKDAGQLQTYIENMKVYSPIEETETETDAFSYMEEDLFGMEEIPLDDSVEDRLYAIGHRLDEKSHLTIREKQDLKQEILNLNLEQSPEALELLTKIESFPTLLISAAAQTSKVAMETFNPQANAQVGSLTVIDGQLYEVTKATLGNVKGHPIGSKEEVSLDPSVLEFTPPFSPEEKEQAVVLFFSGIRLPTLQNHLQLQNAIQAYPKNETLETVQTLWSQSLRSERIKQAERGRPVSYLNKIYYIVSKETVEKQEYVTLAESPSQKAKYKDVPLSLVSHPMIADTEDLVKIKGQDGLLRITQFKDGYYYGVTQGIRIQIKFGVEDILEIQKANTTEIVGTRALREGELRELVGMQPVRVKDPKDGQQELYFDELAKDDQGVLVAYLAYEDETPVMDGGKRKIFYPTDLWIPMTKQQLVETPPIPRRGDLRSRQFTVTQKLVNELRNPDLKLSLDKQGHLVVSERNRGGKTGRNSEEVFEEIRKQIEADFISLDNVSEWSELLTQLEMSQWYQDAVKNFPKAAEPLHSPLISRIRVKKDEDTTAELRSAIKKMDNGQKISLDHGQVVVKDRELGLPSSTGKNAQDTLTELAEIIKKDFEKGIKVEDWRQAIYRLKDNAWYKEVTESGKATPINLPELYSMSVEGRIAEIQQHCLQPSHYASSILAEDMEFIANVLSNLSILGKMEKNSIFDESQIKGFSNMLSVLAEKGLVKQQGLTKHKSLLNDMNRGRAAIQTALTLQGENKSLKEANDKLLEVALSFAPQAGLTGIELLKSENKDIHSIISIAEKMIEDPRANPSELLRIRTILRKQTGGNQEVPPNLSAALEKLDQMAPMLVGRAIFDSNKRDVFLLGYRHLPYQPVTILDAAKAKLNDTAKNPQKIIEGMKKAYESGWIDEKSWVEFQAEVKNHEELSSYFSLLEAQPPVVATFPKAEANLPQNILSADKDTLAASITARTSTLYNNFAFHNYDPDHPPLELAQEQEQLFSFVIVNLIANEKEIGAKYDFWCDICNKLVESGDLGSAQIVFGVLNSSYVTRIPLPPNKKIESLRVLFSEDSRFKNLRNKQMEGFTTPSIALLYDDLFKAVNETKIEEDKAEFVHRIAIQRNRAKPFQSDKNLYRLDYPNLTNKDYYALSQQAYKKPQKA